MTMAMTMATAMAMTMAMSLGPTLLYADKPSPKNDPFFGTFKKNRSVRTIKMAVVSRRDLSFSILSRRKPFTKNRRDCRPIGPRPGMAGRAGQLFFPVFFFRNYARRMTLKSRRQLLGC